MVVAARFCSEVISDGDEWRQVAGGGESNQRLTSLSRQPRNNLTRSKKKRVLE